MANHYRFPLLFLLLLPVRTVRADRFRIIDNPTEALQCRIDLIQQAKTEILVSYYIIKDDESGKCLLGLLADAAQRGVLVRVLMDANASKISRNKLSWLRQQGVQFRKFRIRSDLRRLWHRLHDKILLTDFNTLVVGGRNLKNEYFGIGKNFNFQDCDALIQSDSAGYEARTHFYSIWNRPHLSREPYNLPSMSEQKASATARIFLENRQKIAALLSLQFDTQRNWLEGLPPLSYPVHFIHDDFFRREGDVFVETMQKDLGSTKALIALLSSAQQSVVWENPYLSPTRRWRKAFKKMTQQGVHIRILTNSKTSTDVRWHHLLYSLHKKRLQRMGIELWEYQGPEKLHTKTMVIDAEIIVIGSYNLHYQSQRYNTEVAVWVRDPAIAATHLQRLDAHLQTAKQVRKNRLVAMGGDPVKN